MLDFLRPAPEWKKDGWYIKPSFVLRGVNDLMIKGGDFYAVWVEKKKLWSTDESELIELVDDDLQRFAENWAARYPEANVTVLGMNNASTGSIDIWHKYCQKQSRDRFHMLDDTIVFSNTETCRETYATKRLEYPIEKTDIHGYEKLISTLYSEEERRKIEWAIGSIVNGDSKRIQKFLVFYGSAGTGKSTILNIIQQLFAGYYAIFDAKSLGNPSNSFALEPFKCNPLVAIQHDGDLSKIEDNTRLNSLVSHEEMTVNEKFKSQYTTRFQCMLFMGTNKPVKITDAKSGLLRRLVDVHPTGKKLSREEYEECMRLIPYELGGIAAHCLEVYNEFRTLYDDYEPKGMIEATNDFYNFVVDSFRFLNDPDGVDLAAAWERYNKYCDDARVTYPMTKRAFREELRNYYESVTNEDNGSRIVTKYSGLKIEKILGGEKSENVSVAKDNRISFDSSVSIFDEECSACFAQYASSEGTPMRSWDGVSTTLSELDTSKLHYVRVPENHIVIDFDLKGADGEKNLELNIEAASKFPPTYAELSKSGKGIHLHYIYAGDVNKLSRIYDENIEIKVFTGKSSLRRQLSKCNELPIMKISGGLPLKEENKVTDWKGFTNEKVLRKMIIKNLNKEYFGNTAPSVQFIKKLLDESYESGQVYDVSDLRNDIFAFAMQSHNQSEACLKLVKEMKFASENTSVNIKDDVKPIVFFDSEVFPNLLLLNYKFDKDDNDVIRMINPSPNDISEFVHRFRLIGFYNLAYDNHILYARMIGYSNAEIYELSSRLVSNDKDVSRLARFREAMNLSYTDIYDFASAGNKKSLKKLEIEMGIHHKELGYRWDEPVPEKDWEAVAEYCDNDVIATQKAFHYLEADWTARQILADLADMTVNDSTNSLTAKIILDNDRRAKNQFVYRDMSKPVMNIDPQVKAFLEMACPKMMEAPHGTANSILPYFDGYKFENGVSTYRGFEVGEGGFVYSEPGMYGNVALLDISSMHPHSAIAECVFGPVFTGRFRDIVEGRVSIKHEDWDVVNTMLDGKLVKFVERVKRGEMSSKQLANALKTAINSVYGLTCTKYSSAFKDDRNVDNIVAKRGALFMIDLKHEVEARGFKVAHIKTDSIKIPDATPEIIQFVMDFGQRYGYSFEHEATYDRMCLVNDAVYIAKYAPEFAHGCPWTATGAQFAEPYVFKTLFSKEDITLDDLSVTKSVKTALYLDKNENLGDEHKYIFVGKVGLFCPMKPGANGGILLKTGTDKNGATKYDHVVGTSGYRWDEQENVREFGKEGLVDRSYFDTLVSNAIDDISKYGDFSWFVSDDPYISPANLRDNPPWEGPSAFDVR